MKIIKKVRILSKLLYTIVFTYVRLYPRYIFNSLMSLHGRLKMSKSERVNQSASCETETEDEDDETFDAKNDFLFETSKIGKLQYRKLSQADLVNLERLMNRNLAERCERLFECTIENYQFRFLTVVLVVFNVICFLHQEFIWSRTLIFILFQLLLTNLPFWIYLLNSIQYYKMRFKLEAELIVNYDSSPSMTKCLLAFEDSNCIGYSVALIQQANQAELVNLYVMSGFRNLYIGKHLMSSTLFHLKLNRVSKVVCLVEANNCGAVCFMENTGFDVMDKLNLAQTGYSTLIESISHRNRSTYIYFRVLNFYYLFFEIDLSKFN